MPSGLIRYGLDGDYTDLWGDGASVNRLLETVSDHFVSRDHDRVLAHVNTPRGRVYVHRGDTDPWAPPRIPARELLDLLDSLSLLLGVTALQYSPNYRGLSFLDWTRKDNRAWFERDDLPEESTFDPTPNFTKKLPKSDIGNVLHAFDMRSAWLSSARTAECGYGEKRRVTTFDPHAAGIWTVNLTKGVIVNDAPIMFPGMYPTAIVRAAFDRRQPIEVVGGWVFAGQSAALRNLSERLIRARAQADTLYVGDKRAWIIGAIKAVYTRTFGSLQHKHKGARSWAYQPYWYESLRAESARRIWRLYDTSPYYMGIDVDTLYAVAPPEVPYHAIMPQANPDAFVPGTWAYKGSTPLSRPLFDLLGGGTGADLSRELRSRNLLEGA